MTNLRQSMRSCVESFYPILYLVTFEEEKGDALIGDLADGRKILEWNMARGCVRFDTKAPLTPTYMDLPAALENWLDQELDNHFLIIRNAHLALRDAPLAISRLKALVRRMVHDDGTVATIFLVSSQSCVPPELENFITVFDQTPPEEEEISRLIHDHASDYGYDVDEEVADKLILALRGLSEYEITRLLNRGFQRDGAIGADDIALVIEEKKQIVRKSGILEMVSVTGGMDTVGGLEALKAWLERKAAIMGDLPAARAFGVETPRGAMIAGMPGCGKSLTAKAASVLFGLPLLRLDIGALMGRYVGDSEANMRRALRLAETVQPLRSVGGRAGESLHRHRRRQHRRRLRDHQPPVRLLPDLDAGEHQAGVRARHRQRCVRPAARASAQGPLRRNLLRRFPEPERTRRDPGGASPEAQEGRAPGSTCNNWRVRPTGFQEPIWKASSRTPSSRLSLTAKPTSRPLICSTRWRRTSLMP